MLDHLHRHRGESMKIELYQGELGWTAEIVNGFERIKIETPHSNKFSESYIYNRMKALNPKAMIVFKPSPLNL